MPLRPLDVADYFFASREMATLLPMDSAAARLVRGLNTGEAPPAIIPQHRRPPPEQLSDATVRIAVLTVRCSMEMVGG